ncbi:SMP-30/gluconolactonase/LRE family protein [Alkalicoccus urumqiensis]|uniref:SMP-30/Gluconolactonase/LRE-like region domain-containing protein n=1 Tax=Alkalicoccus urumqiensis TaxID=1548213 RepID=A0A2P6MJ51_ALKUR|nr:SMP-30/gluconolactonase/LRE family protein [Alkalicoccus urumqiensis]PRO66318.1 hypothetical protein C6I21_05810 [Alkalicoccus urumqiensis]
MIHVTAAEFIYDAKAKLAEGPFWDEKSNQLLWVDIDGGRVHFYDPETGKNRSYAMGQRVGCAVLGTSGLLYTGMDHGLYRNSLETGEQTQLTDPETDKPGNRFNDGKCDPQGRFWAGTMVLEGNDGGASLYRMEHDQSLTVQKTGVTVSNGMAWDEANLWMYYIDTPSETIYRYDFDPESGAITNETTAFQTTELEGHPDGMTIDNEGKLWVAFFGGGCVRRFDPENGTVLETIEVEASNVTSCCFGGRDWSTLYITTGKEEDEPKSGGLFAIDLPVSGAKSHRYLDSPQT